MLLCYVAGREHHARENRRFAEQLKANGCESSVLEAKGKTHLSVELEIGSNGDAVTDKISVSSAHSGRFHSDHEIQVFGPSVAVGSASVCALDGSLCRHGLARYSCEACQAVRGAEGENDILLVGGYGLYAEKMQSLIERILEKK